MCIEGIYPLLLLFNESLKIYIEMGTETNDKEKALCNTEHRDKERPSGSKDETVLFPTFDQRLI